MGQVPHPGTGWVQEFVSSTSGLLVHSLSSPGRAEHLMVPSWRGVFVCCPACDPPPLAHRLPLLASYQQGLLVSLELLGLAAPSTLTALEELRRLALARAQLSEEEVRHHTASRLVWCVGARERHTQCLELCCSS